MNEILIIEIDDLLWKNPNDGKFEILEFLIKRKGIWEFHKYDKDPFPSKPHGHNKETKEKLDVYTGKKYDYLTKKCTGVLHERMLIEIQNRLKEQGFL